MKLLIVIPAYNEEDSIVQTIDRTLSARDRLLNESPISSVEVTVVSDGSDDRTVELCRRFEGQINLIVFTDNRGYGAAIKHAWERSDAELLGFLDADGTCDPEFFVDLTKAIDGERADIAVGSRLHPSSQMPAIRRIGNSFFAVVISTLSSTRVRDAASGMRVVRAASLAKILPLPDGLNFTPAMSARAALSADLKVVELDMPYRERLGTSKLRIFMDGLRFLRVILETTLLYRPSVLLVSAGIVCLGITIPLSIAPTRFYAAHGQILEWMIYRFVVVQLLVLAGFLLISGGYLAGRMAAMTLTSDRVGISEKAARKVLRKRWFWLIPLSLVSAGGVLVFPSLLELVRTGVTYEHWSRFIAMSALVGTAIILTVLRVLDFVLTLLSERLDYLRRRAEAANNERSNELSGRSG